MNASDWVAVEQLLAGKRAFKDAHEHDRAAAIVHLHVQDGLDVPEIANRLQASPTSVRLVLRKRQERLDRLAAREVA